MNSRDKIAAKSGVFYTISSFATTGISFVSVPIFTRLMSTVEYGDYNNFTSWIAILTVVASLNLGSTFIRARFDFEDKYNTYVFSIQVLSLISVSLWVLFSNVLYPYIFGLIKMSRLNMNLLWVYIFGSQIVSMFQSVDQYNYKYKRMSLISVGLALFTTLLSIGLVIGYEDKLEGRIIGYVVPYAIMGIIMFIYFFRKANRVSIDCWKYALPICLPYIPHLLSLCLLNSMDRIMITDICGSEETALYSLAYSCSYFITILVSAINTAYVPWLSDCLHDEQYERINKFSYKYIAFFVYCVLGIVLIAPEFLLILGGRNYISAKWVMPPVMIGCAMQLMYTMCVNVEQYYKKTKGMAIASVSAALLNFILNSIFIPKFGYVAAAYTTLICYVFLLIMHMVLVRKIIRLYDYKFFVLMVAVLLGWCFLSNLIYINNYIRYGCIGVFIVIGFILVIKNRKYITRFFKRG